MDVAVVVCSRLIRFINSLKEYIYMRILTLLIFDSFYLELDIALSFFCF